MTDITPPKHLGITREITLTGMLFAVNKDLLVLINMAGVDEDICYLPLFEDVDQLKAVLKKVGISFTGIKQVLEGGEFLESIPLDLIVVTNLRFTDEGKTRYTQVQR